MGWKFNDNIPIYIQMMTRIKIKIANGTYGNDAKLPTVRELALEAGVNPNTVQKAFMELEREGLLYTERTSGRYISNDDQILADLKQNLCLEYIQNFVHHLEELGIVRSAIPEMVVKYLKEIEE